MSARATTSGAQAAALVIAEARRADADRLAASLRAADRQELAALGRAPLPALREALAVSERSFGLWTADGALAALFGVAPYPGCGRAGVPWMMGSDALQRLSIPFLRRCGPWIEALGEGRDVLVNAVDARNQLHIRWLGWAGFTFIGRRALGPERRPFLEFAKLVRASEAGASGDGFHGGFHV